MANNITGTNIAASIVPFTDADTFPTHISLYGQGGYREIKTLNDRDSIPEARRIIGMLVYVQETGEIWKLTDKEKNTYELFSNGSPTASVKRLKTFDDLPSVGDPNVLYIITETYDSYIWDSDKIQFRQLNEITENNLKINTITCGDSKNG